MPPHPFREAFSSKRALVAGGLVVMVTFGEFLSFLPNHLVLPVIAIANGFCNLVALALFTLRAREPGVERRGWQLLAVSMAVLMASNAAMTPTPTTFTFMTPAQLTFVGLSLIVAVLQLGGLLSWPFRPQVAGSHRVLNQLGSLLFLGSVFLCTWSTIILKEWEGGQWRIVALMLGLSFRTAIVGGAAAYFLADDPRRIRGPVGWILLGMVLQTLMVVLGRPYLFNEQGTLQASRVFGLSVGIPLTFIASAVFRVPVEVPEESPPLKYPMIDGLLFLPFFAASVAVVHSSRVHHEHHRSILIGFMCVCAILVARQFILLRDMRRANDETRRANEYLEERVMARTRSLEEMQATLLRTERMNSIALLGAGLAHDLNNALSSVRAYTQIMREDLEQGEAVSSARLDRILQATDQAVTLTGRLMSFGRPEDSSQGRTDLPTTIRTMEPILRMLLTRDISLQMTLAQLPMRVCLSRSQVEQILVNMVANARDAMIQGGSITLLLTCESGASHPTALLQIQDSGPGMPPEIRERIFDAFFTTKGPGRGTGLGLASVQHLMDEAGGSIDVESELGAGTTFTLRFPLDP